MSSRVRIFSNPAQVAEAAAAHFYRSARQAVAKRGGFSVALSGGSTPARLFRILAASPDPGKMPWEQTAVFWGDERAVPPDHPDSNYRAAKQLLIDHVPLLEENIHRIQSELDPRLAAARYEETLRAFLRVEVGDQDRVSAGGGLDLIFLGMGEDGHTASLFPHSSALGETTDWVVGDYVEQLETWRITMTAPFINAAKQVIFLVTGEGKRARLKEVLQGPRDPQTLPSQLIEPAVGDLIWLVDQAAASLLD